MWRLIHGVLLVAWLAASVRADSSADLFAQGVKLLEKGDAAAACTKFQEALAARPGAPGVLLNLGLCNLKQNKLATALKWFREAQLRAAERGQADTETAAKKETVRLAALVPALRLEPSAPLPDGATIVLDGELVDPISYSRVEVDAGPHTIVVSGRGLERTEQTIEVPEGPELHVVPLTVRAAAKPVPVEPIVKPRGGHRGLAIGLAATSVVAFAVGGFFLWDAGYLADRRDEALAECTLASPCSGAVLEDYDRRGSRANTLAYAGFIAGGVTLAASVVLFAMAPRDSASVAVAPVPGGALVARTFAW